MSQIEIRQLHEKDLERVARIEQAITRKEASRRWLAMARRHLTHTDLPGFVALDLEKVVGFILGEVKTGGFGAELSGWIEIVGVEPDYMGRGIGDALCHRLCSHFITLGVDRVFTSVRWDAGDLLAFFKKQGFDRSPFINLQLSLKD